jgi:hypothetical protein
MAGRFRYREVVEYVLNKRESKMVECDVLVPLIWTYLYGEIYNCLVIESSMLY